MKQPWDRRFVVIRHARQRSPFFLYIIGVSLEVV